MLRLGPSIIHYTGWQSPFKVPDIRKWIFHRWNNYWVPSPFIIFPEEDADWSDIRILGFTFEQIARIE